MYAPHYLLCASQPMMSLFMTSGSKNIRFQVKRQATNFQYILQEFNRRSANTQV
uniref:Uncharacterized protein n=1 Tax=Arundo donax TaxID=35708 RepID=A0A0A9GT02_ARUDO